MKREFMPTDAPGRLWHLVEEAAEVQKLCSKINRFGPRNHHPDDATKTTNAQLLLDELQDLAVAMALDRCGMRA